MYNLAKNQKTLTLIELFDNQYITRVAKNTYDKSAKNDTISLFLKTVRVIYTEKLVNGAFRTHYRISVFFAESRSRGIVANLLIC